MTKLAMAVLVAAVMMCGTSVFAADQATTSTTTDKNTASTTKKVKKTKKDKTKKASLEKQLSDLPTGPIAY